MLNDSHLASGVQQQQLMGNARQEIELLRRWYAIATDALGRTDDADARAQGIEIYDRIFSSDARISVAGGPRDLSGTGPRAWVDVATTALADYQATQHLIGSQVVTFSDLQFGNQPEEVVGGRAKMSSYVQAWHAWPDRKMRLVIGRYEDAVRFNPGIGWQIDNMVLVYESGETRELGLPP